MLIERTVHGAGRPVPTSNHGHKKGRFGTGNMGKIQVFLEITDFIRVQQSRFFI
jgi:hypothetical protein